MEPVVIKKKQQQQNSKAEDSSNIRHVFRGPSLVGLIISHFSHFSVPSWQEWDSHIHPPSQNVQSLNSHSVNKNKLNPSLGPSARLACKTPEWTRGVRFLSSGDLHSENNFIFINVKLTLNNSVVTFLLFFHQESFWIKFVVDEPCLGANSVRSQYDSLAPKYFFPAPLHRLLWSNPLCSGKHLTKCKQVMLSYIQCWLLKTPV